MTTSGNSNFTKKQLLLASPRGYCAGVYRAIKTLKTIIKNYGSPIYVLHEIVHNKHVVENLINTGAIFVEDVSQIPNSSIVIFSAHGVAPLTYKASHSRNLTVIDATCPLVTKIHREAKRFASENYNIILIGHKEHEEVIGTFGEAPENIQIIDEIDAVDLIKVSDTNKVAWLSQTTLSISKTMEIVSKLRKKFPKLQNPPSDDICYATQNRQVSIKAIASKCDLIIVVGSKNSSNSVRLAEVALESGSKTSYLVDCADNIQLSWLKKANTIGITSGASVPETLIISVVKYLSKYGYVPVRSVATFKEKLVFALPKQARSLI